METTQTIKTRQKYEFEWNDLRALVQVVDVALIMIYGLVMAWAGIGISLIGICKALFSKEEFRWSRLIIQLACLALNIYFLVCYYTI